MKTLVVAIICVIAGFGLAYLLFPAGDDSSQAVESVEKQQYTCGMHPEIISDEPGYCPICEMKLSPKKDGSTDASVIIDAATEQNTGIATTESKYGKITRSIHAFGEANYSESDIHSVNLKVSGWIEKLYITYEGQQAVRGKPLFDIYSPQLVTAQQEYIMAHESAKTSTNDNFSNLEKAAKLRLKSWDISDSQIDNLLKTGEVSRTLTIYSPANGAVIVKNVNEGNHFMAGKELFRIADLSKIWVIAHIYEQDLPFISVGQETVISFPNIPGQSYTAEVTYISPYIDDKHQVTIRMELDNNKLAIKPEMYAEIELKAELPSESIIVPRSSIINSGKRKIVYIKTGEGRYEPKVVTSGAVGDNDMVEIKAGLNAGDIIVTSGQFLLDSESRLSEAVGQVHNHGTAEGSKINNDMEPGREMNQGHDHAGESDNHSSVADHQIYTCPMPEHYHVLQFGQGKCPECNMNLVPVQETDNENVYVCPMDECQIVSNEQGRCPKCNMKLKQYEETAPSEIIDSINDDHQMYICPNNSCGIAKKLPGDCPECGRKLEPLDLTGESDEVTVGIYTCPMPAHFNVLQYGEGKCPECGMKLVPLEETENMEVYACPMTECGIVQDHPGDCSVCGMKLVKHDREQSHDQ